MAFVRQIFCVKLSFVVSLSVSVRKKSRAVLAPVRLFLEVDVFYVQSQVFFAFVNFVTVVLAASEKTTRKQTLVGTGFGFAGERGQIFVNADFRFVGFRVQVFDFDFVERMVVGKAVHRKVFAEAGIGVTAVLTVVPARVTGVKVLRVEAAETVAKVFSDFEVTETVGK